MKENLMKENKKMEEASMKTEDVDCMYFSKKTKKMYNSMEELKKAESEFLQKEQAEKQARNQKKAEAKEVEEAYANVVKVKKEAVKNIEAAEKNYNEKLHNFVNKYGSFHMSYSVGDTDKDFVSVVNSVLEDWPFKFFNF